MLQIMPSLLFPSVWFYLDFMLKITRLLSGKINTYRFLWGYFMQNQQLRFGMAGLGMIFEETYLPVFLQASEMPLWSQKTGPVTVSLDALYSRTGIRGNKIISLHGINLGNPKNYLVNSSSSLHGLNALDALIVATPDDRHFDLSLQALHGGKHVLVEKPSVLKLQELDDLITATKDNHCLTRVVYHKLLDPDHKKLRTLVSDGFLRKVRSGYCSLLEPRQISSHQFAEWIHGRNPGSYVAVHYIKLIDFTFGISTGQEWRIKRVSATGQRGIAGPPKGSTWDSVQLRIEYQYPDFSEAAFDIHTSWVNPDCFPGYVEQETQFRFENSIWLAHQRKRGVELSIADMTPLLIKETPNNHYNADILEPWDIRKKRGYGLETIQKFIEDLAYLEYGGIQRDRNLRLRFLQKQTWCDISGERNTVAIVQAMEAILDAHANGHPGGVATFNDPAGGLVLRFPGSKETRILYAGQI